MQTLVDHQRQLVHDTLTEWKPTELTNESDYDEEESCLPVFMKHNSVQMKTPYIAAIFTFAAECVQSLHSPQTCTVSAARAAAAVLLMASPDCRAHD